jgi:hypothetical protein
MLQEEQENSCSDKVRPRWCEALPRAFYPYRLCLHRVETWRATSLQIKRTR